MKTVNLIICLSISLFSSGQNIATRLLNSIKGLEADAQFKHAILSLYVVNSKTGQVVFDQNAQVGLAPASCQKVITSVTAFEMLGKNYSYKTRIGYVGTIKENVLNGNLYILVSGDPTLGSWRWNTTSSLAVLQNVTAALKAKNILIINGDIIVNDTKWESQATPRGWIWEDIGNYYGAGARGINWHENQYDLVLQPGNKEGDSVKILNTIPELQVSLLVNELKTGIAGSGDNSIIYLPEESQVGYIRGTVPAGNETFTVKGAIPNTAVSFMRAMKDFLNSQQIKITGQFFSGTNLLLNKEKIFRQPQFIVDLISPSLDSINYWFLKKSVNLFGEAFIKTIAFEKTKFGSTDTGLMILKDFWNDKGIEKSSLNMLDGSGLSPANRITTQVLVTVMQYAKKQLWFSSFYHALPEANGIKMKDGYISGVRSYTGYVKSKAGVEFTFSFIVNNFTGSPGSVREKMWKLLDILK